MGLSKGHLFATEIVLKITRKRMKSSDVSDDNIEVIFYFFKCCESCGGMLTYLFDQYMGCKKEEETRLTDE